MRLDIFIFCRLQAEIGRKGDATETDCEIALVEKKVTKIISDIYKVRRTYRYTHKFNLYTLPHQHAAYFKLRYCVRSNRIRLKGFEKALINNREILQHKNSSHKVLIL